MFRLGHQKVQLGSEFGSKLASRDGSKWDGWATAPSKRRGSKADRGGERSMSARPAWPSHVRCARQAADGRTTPSWERQMRSQWLSRVAHSDRGLGRGRGRGCRCRRRGLRAHEERPSAIRADTVYGLSGKLDTSPQDGKRSPPLSAPRTYGRLTPL